MLRFFRTESFRVAIVYGVIFSMAMAVLGVVALSIVQRAMQEQILRRAETELTVTRRFYKNDGLARAVLYTQNRGDHSTSFDFIVLQQNGRRLAGNMPAIPPQPGRQIISVPGLSGHTMLGLGMALAPGIYTFSGTDLAYIDMIRAQIITVLLWMFGGTMILSSLGGFLLSRRFLARTDAITRTCEAIMAGNLADRIATRGSADELDRLARTINAMLERIAGLMENLRQVSNDVAHDLRTPLSNLRHELERTRAEATSPQQYAEALDRAIGSTDEILALFAALLRISQIEGGARRAGFAPVDMTLLLQRLTDVYQAVADDAGHVLTTEASAPCTVRGDQGLLFQMLSNLVENAIVHTPPGTTITAGYQQDAGSVTIHVRDNGPGVPPEERQKLFQRFFRREASRTNPGHGLGLALAAAVVELHGGQITAKAPAGGNGLEFVVTLPCSGCSG